MILLSMDWILKSFALLPEKDDPPEPCSPDRATSLRSALIDSSGAIHISWNFCKKKPQRRPSHGHDGSIVMGTMVVLFAIMKLFAIVVLSPS
jgi:hypothetical protein